MLELIEDLKKRVIELEQNGLPPYLTRQESAKVLGVNVDVIRFLLEKGYLTEAIYIGSKSRTKIRKKDVLDLKIEFESVWGIDKKFTSKMVTEYHLYKIKKEG